MDGFQREYMAKFCQTHYQKLFLHASAILREQGLAEEAVQEAFQIACQKPDDLMESEKPLGWMKKTVENTALHILRQQRTAQALFQSLEYMLDDRELAAPSESVIELTDRCLSAVTREELDFFLRVTMEGYTFAEESERLGISLAACYKRFERVRKRLRAALEKD